MIYVQAEAIFPQEFDVDFVNENSSGIMMLGQLLSQWKSIPPVDSGRLLQNLLMNGKELKGIIVEEGFPIKEGIYTWSRLEFREYWLDLYNLARKVGRAKDLRSHWALLLTYLGFREDDKVHLDQLTLLQTVAVNSDSFAGIDPPEFEGYSMTKEWGFSRPIITKLVLR
jgi:hypothetical protein